MPTPCVKKAKTAFVEEAGRIAAITEREIQTGSLWPLKRITETTFDTSKGSNPRTIRMMVAPPPRTEYTPILASGNEAKNFPNPQGGADIASFGDKQGRGCNIPAERIRWGYDEFGRCLRATALETDPMCVLDMIEKHQFVATIAKLRQKMPQFAKEHFANELLRQVVRFSYHKWSVADGLPVSTNVATFPAIPTGGLNIGLLRHIENIMRAHGWDEGAKTPVIGGRPALQVYAGRDSIDFAIVQRKKQLGLVNQTTIRANDGTFGDTEIYEGIQFIENPMPPRGYLVQTAAGAWEFREISPYTIRAGGIEGIVVDPNPDYRGSFINVGGSSYVVVEVGFIVHPDAMERQAMGAIPNVDGKSFSRRFNFEVNMVPDWAIVPPECNKDGFWIQYRMLHAYAPLPYNPEKMTAFIYIAATPQVVIANPNPPEAPIAPANQPISMAPFLAPLADGCVSCADVADARNPVPPTCTDIFPANGVGLMRQTQLAYDVQETAVGLTIVVERAGGNVGAASVNYTTTPGTALAAVNYTTTAGTLNWADGEFGKKSFVVPILNAAGDDNGKQFTTVLSVPVGAALGTPTTSTVTILDPDAA